MTVSNIYDIFHIVSYLHLRAGTGYQAVGCWDRATDTRADELNPFRVCTSRGGATTGFAGGYLYLTAAAVLCGGYMLQSDKEKGLHPESGHNKETVEKSEILPNPDTGICIAGVCLLTFVFPQDRAFSKLV